MQKILLVLMLLSISSTPALAHVGNANVYYEGNAGPYHLYVTVVLPKVVPGIAELQIRSSSSDIHSIQVVTMRLSGSGSSFSAVPDNAVQSKDDPQFFVSNLWLMEFGAMKVRLTVRGEQGEAILSVPIASYAQQALPMSMLLRCLMIILTLLLIGGAVLVPAALVRESSVPAGASLGKADLRRGRVATVCALALAMLLLYAGRAAWKGQAAQYNSYLALLRPPLAQTMLNGSLLYIRPAAPLRLPLVGQDTLGDPVNMDELLPDHGHKMHLFLIDAQGMKHMWHLHPDATAQQMFVDKLPPIPSGLYKVFADIVDQTGYPWTLVGEINVPTSTDGALTGDDSAWMGPALAPSTAPRLASPLPGGGRIVFDRAKAPLHADRPGVLHFSVYDGNGDPARDLEPYMGMAAHAEIVCSDWSVFAHLHPSGSVSMPSLGMAEGRLSPTLSAMADGMGMSGPVSPEIEFPFGFSHSGNYRIFLQIKRQGQPQSAAFDVHVQ